MNSEFARQGHMVVAEHPLAARSLPALLLATWFTGPGPAAPSVDGGTARAIADGRQHARHRPVRGRSRLLRRLVP